MTTLTRSNGGNRKSTPASFSATKNLQSKGYPVIAVDADKSTCPHDMLHPGYVGLPVIGPQFGGDPELIAAQEPDLVFVTETATSNLDALPSQPRIPVVGIVCGGLDTPDSIQTFCDSLTDNGSSVPKEKPCNGSYKL
ncbi:MAG: hypothetical protein NWF05_09530 [Candidatus Bathyarchaeota archaeon]|nr:hypothetical protein [Candidatus Bathyarchaeota archaeon]